MPRSQVEFLYHILDETTYLIKGTQGLSQEAFLSNEDLKRAFSRSIEIMGEAAKNVSDELKNTHPHIPWKGMARMRDKLIHHYFGVDYELLWEVVTEEVPRIHELLSNLLENLP